MKNNVLVIGGDGYVSATIVDELFSRKKLIKSILGYLLERKYQRFTILRIRLYFLKWYRK